MAMACKERRRPPSTCRDSPGLRARSLIPRVHSARRTGQRRPKSGRSGGSDRALSL
jgi:hypothetical protein